MDTPSFSWYNTFTPLFEPLPNPSPAKVIPQLRSMLETLTSEDLGWELNQIHLFGYAQGGTTALELCLDVGKSGIGPSKARRLGSAVSVHGPLISFPSAPLNLSTPVLYFTRSDPRSQISQKVCPGCYEGKSRLISLVIGGGVAAPCFRPSGCRTRKGRSRGRGRHAERQGGMAGDHEVLGRAFESRRGMERHGGRIRGRPMTSADWSAQ